MKRHQFFVHSNLDKMFSQSCVLLLQQILTGRKESNRPNQSVRPSIRYTQYTDRHNCCTIDCAPQTCSPDGEYDGSNNLTTTNYNMAESALWNETEAGAGGSKQSPINLLSDDAVHSGKLGKLCMSYYPTRDAEITNDGCGIHITPKYCRKDSNRTEYQCMLQGDPLGLESNYLLNDIVFHWGKEDIRGSEHMINDKSYPMEVQFVHMKSDCDTVTEAYSQADGVVISTMFFTPIGENAQLKPIVAALDDVTYKGESTVLSTYFNPELLLPDEQLRDYWLYEGSLTQPPCSECVTWIIYRYPAIISSQQLEQFRRLKSHGRHSGSSTPEDDGFLADNFRPVQATNGRTVWKSFHT